MKCLNLHSIGFPHTSNLERVHIPEEQENFVLIIGLASWAGAATFGLLAAVALLAFIARKTGKRARESTQPEFVICTREERDAEVTRL